MNRKSTVMPATMKTLHAAMGAALMGMMLARDPDAPLDPPMSLDAAREQLREVMPVVQGQVGPTPFGSLADVAAGTSALQLEIAGKLLDDAISDEELFRAALMFTAFKKQLDDLANPLAQALQRMGITA